MFWDDTTCHACDRDLNSLIRRLESGSFLDIEWFENSDMILNQDKCSMLIPGYNNENIWIHKVNEKTK